MPTQKEIAAHLGVTQQAVSDTLARLGLDWRLASMDEIRITYIGHLRSMAAGHKAEDGVDLVRERVLTERVDREVKMLTLAEKKGVLVNVAQLEAELSNMVGAFRAELLARDDKLKSELDALYGIEVDIGILNEHTFTALSQLARYDRGGMGSGAPAGQDPDPAGTDDDHGVGA